MKPPQPSILTKAKAVKDSIVNKCWGFLKQMLGWKPFTREEKIQVEFGCSKECANLKQEQIQKRLQSK